MPFLRTLNNCILHDIKNNLLSASETEIVLQLYCTKQSLNNHVECFLASLITEFICMCMLMSKK